LVERVKSVIAGPRLWLLRFDAKAAFGHIEVHLSLFKIDTQGYRQTPGTKPNESAGAIQSAGHGKFCVVKPRQRASSRENSYSRHALARRKR
jgi:hypothetical protein